MRYYLIMATILLLPFVTQAANKPVCKDDVHSDQSIEAAIQEGNDSDSDVDVNVLKICGDYAKAYVTSMDDDESQTAYLKKTTGKWAILDIGTGTDPADLHIPKEVW
jgi:FlaG/FlaF family flagellin (archaellin)